MVSAAKNYTAIIDITTGRRAEMSPELLVAVESYGGKET